MPTKATDPGATGEINTDGHVSPGRVQNPGEIIRG